MIAHTNNQRRYLADNSTSTGFTLTAGRDTLANLQGSDFTFFPLGTIRRQGGDSRFSGVRLTAIGDGADNSTFDYRVFVGFIENPDDPIDEQVVSLFYMGGGSATLSTAVGVGSDLMSASERAADTLTWTLGASTTTPKGIGETIETARGQGRASAAWSPADNTEAFVDIPELGGAAYLVIDFDLTGATGANFLIEALD